MVVKFFPKIWIQYKGLLRQNNPSVSEFFRVTSLWLTYIIIFFITGFLINFNENRKYYLSFAFLSNKFSVAIIFFFCKLPVVNFIILFRKKCQTTKYFVIFRLDQNFDMIHIFMKFKTKLLSLCPVPWEGNIIMYSNKVTDLTTMNIFYSFHTI